jgi:hypothetical protein
MPHHQISIRWRAHVSRFLRWAEGRMVFNMHEAGRLSGRLFAKSSRRYSTGPRNPAISNERDPTPVPQCESDFSPGR